MEENNFNNIDQENQRRSIIKSENKAIMYILLSVALPFVSMGIILLWILSGPKDSTATIVFSSLALLELFFIFMAVRIGLKLNKKFGNKLIFFVLAVLGFLVVRFIVLPFIYSLSST